jgi:hypothetical protein
MRLMLIVPRIPPNATLGPSTGFGERGNPESRVQNPFSPNTLNSVSSICS